LIYQNAGDGLFTNEGLSGSPEVLAYNNVFWGNGTGGLNKSGIYINSEAVTLRNNIVAESSGEELVEAGSYALDSDYNLFYHSTGGSLIIFDSISYGLEDWKLHSAQDFHSISVDPQFLNAHNADFRLSNNSPAIHMGFNLGTPFKDALDPRTVFPYGTVNQGFAGLGWNAGPFANF
jgi:hypothetical protein